MWRQTYAAINKNRLVQNYSFILRKNYHFLLPSEWRNDKWLTIFSWFVTGSRYQCRWFHNLFLFDRLKRIITVFHVCLLLINSNVDSSEQPVLTQKKNKEFCNPFLWTLIDNNKTILFRNNLTIWPSGALHLSFTIQIILPFRRNNLFFKIAFIIRTKV